MKGKRMNHSASGEAHESALAADPAPHQAAPAAAPCPLGALLGWRLGKVPPARPGSLFPSWNPFAARCGEAQLRVLPLPSLDVGR